jgi:hypothetical protein
MIKSEKGLKLFIIVTTSIIILQFYLLITKPNTNAFLALNRGEITGKLPQKQFTSIQNETELFKKIALKHGTDKVTTHHYEYVYGQLIGPIRNENINFLEIGLGCGMSYGPGKSIPLWKEFMPNAIISIMEFNEACAKPFEIQVKNLFVGDQSDLSLLKRIGESFYFH